MALVLFLCTLVPVLAATAFTVRSTISNLEERARRTLHHEARAMGQETLGRLDTLSRTLAFFAGSVLVDGIDPELALARMASYAPLMHAVTVLPTRLPPLSLRGPIITPALTRAQLEHLDEWGQLLTPVSEAPGRLALVVRPLAGSAAGSVAVLIDEAGLLALSSSDVVPPDANACIFTSGRLLACSPDAPSEIADQVGRDLRDRDMRIDSSIGPHLVRTWTLPLKPSYDGPSWVFATMRAENVVHAPAGAFIRNFWLLAALLTMSVGWVTLTQVRRILRPLDQLTAATSRLAARDFSQPVAVRSNDEFELLAAAFNDLSTQLRQQFTELEAFSLGTLAALARTVDAKSHWTAGHSERVTRLATAIAHEMRLPDDEIAHVRHGGLVHDIGKLATPPEILDKPGKLTADERTVLERHPADGVRILEPIQAFAPLLPVVGQHHERWDGEGYPNRLAGTAIARTARVLAVADTYDAMRSDRPYRQGMAHAAALAVIDAGAGTQFDPAVVRAFLTVAPRLEEIVEYRSAVYDAPLP